MSFQVGQKVVCVDDLFRPGLNGELFPKKGEIYTVRSIHTWYKDVGIRLMEIVNTPRNYCGGVQECFFGIESFRPVDYTFGEKIAEVLEESFNQQPVLL